MKNFEEKLKDAGFTREEFESILIHLALTHSRNLGANAPVAPKEVDPENGADYEKD